MRRRPYQSPPKLYERSSLPLIASIFCVFVFLLFSAVVTIAVNSAGCRARFSGYGETSWGPIKGCMVKHRGTWKPSSVFREVDAP